ncbi:Mediator of RNA polymerase II transcription subunit 6 [Erysiphe neolycopersici]|uniref:Mediator of RNA polymerase II transcription subunit 6 n=1 Tax=Erysiphe neolycopersici TaxID=212602 RepID=A0A420I0T7_9PEZI|nr:Mediator of RNA polymerase II transcription subunit 6 [Erysiphe neolycopersici]
MTTKETPLDEIQWRSPQTALEMQGIHSNSILFYFAQSPFFDRTSNNAVLFSQAMFNPNMMHLIQTREAFEGRLKTMTGLEFIVAHEPAEMAPGTGTGVWVIRKQTRRIKQVGESEISVHSSYFVVGENIYMAPSVADVIASRTLSIISSLNNFFSLASSLQNFSPALGHTYLLPALKSSVSSTQPGIPHVGKEDIPLSDVPETKITKTLNTTRNSQNDTDTILATRLFEESINIYLKYGDEYMDENPVTGEPGAFHLSSTGRKEKEKPIPPPTNKGPLQQVRSTHLKTDAALESKERKIEKASRTLGGKIKRKRNKSSVAVANST